jgi:uncharacterized protein
MTAIETKDGATLTVFVKPNSPKFKIELDGDEVVVYSTEEPVKGKVNKEIMKETGKLLGFRVEIISGLTSKQKVLLFRGATKAQAEEALKALNSE